MMNSVRATNALASRNEDNIVGGARRRDPLNPQGKGEEGATLILALIFIVVVSALATALTSWVTSDLKNTSKFTGAQSMESAANSATESALQSVRYYFASSTINASPPQTCWQSGTGSAGTSTGTTQVTSLTITEPNSPVSLSAWCSTLYNPVGTNTRIVTISTCLSTVTPAACANNPLLQAVVVFDDFPATGSLACPSYTTPSSSTTCGSGMSILGWAFGVVPPVVTAPPPTSGPSSSCPASNLVTINGSGFSGATAVNFMPSGKETILPGAIVSNTGTTVTACAANPTLMTTGTYQVTVTTPAGTSATSSNSLLTYTYP